MKFFSLLFQGDVHLATEKKIIPREEYATLVSAQEIVEKAKEDAITQAQEAEKRCQEAEEIARKKGFDAGLSEFYEHILGFEQELKRLHQEMQKHVLPLALKAAKKIVAGQLDLNPETIVNIVMRVLAPLTQSHKVVIYVNRADKEVLEAHRPQLKAMLDQVEVLTIQERDDLSPGSSIIETEKGIINVRLEDQWRALEEAFHKYRKPE